MEYLCPVCKHDDVKFEDESPIMKWFEADRIKVYYVSICDNCSNVYCYKVEVKGRIKDGQQI